MCFTLPPNIGVVRYSSHYYKNKWEGRDKPMFSLWSRKIWIERKADSTNIKKLPGGSFNLTSLQLDEMNVMVEKKISIKCEH